MTHVLLINGASGAGKTTTAIQLVQARPTLVHIHPDGLWDTPNMDAEVILDLALTEATTTTPHTAIIDCQVRPSRISDTAARHGVSWTAVLLDCPDNVREARLLARGWTTATFEKVAGWQHLLRSESEQPGCLTLDTSRLSVQACCDLILKHLDARH